MQEKEIANPHDFTDLSRLPAAGRIAALDIGTKRIGVTVCDQMRITTRALPAIKRTSWKNLLRKVKGILEEFDAAALVLGLPYNFDGTESEMSQEARRLARNFSLSLDIPVYLQDERATTYDARKNLWDQGYSLKETRRLVDSEAAAVILSDFLDRLRQKHEQ